MLEAFIVKLEVLWQRVHMDILTYKDNSKFEMRLIEKKKTVFKWGWGWGSWIAFISLIILIQNVRNIEFSL